LRRLLSLTKPFVPIASTPRLVAGGNTLWTALRGFAIDEGVRFGEPVVFSRIFAWWNGATIGTLFDVGRRADLVGRDEQGNAYYQERVASFNGRPRRWVIYNGLAEASRVPPDWYGWLHHTLDKPPTEDPLVRKPFEKEHLPNLTGTPLAWRPRGSLAATGQRPQSTADYEAWKPEEK
jgi:NADH:ubiquinone oxidoreductase subunit